MPKYCKNRIHCLNEVFTATRVMLPIAICISKFFKSHVLFFSSGLAHKIFIRILYVKKKGDNSIVKVSFRENVYREKGNFVFISMYFFNIHTSCGRYLFFNTFLSHLMIERFKVLLRSICATSMRESYTDKENNLYIKYTYIYIYI